MLMLNIPKSCYVNIHFNRNQVLKKEIVIVYYPTEHQLVDLLTKSLNRSRFQALVCNLMVLSQS